MVLPTTIKPVEWVGSAKEDLSDMPSDVKAVLGLALFEAQTGGKHQDAKPMRGFKGAGILEIIDDFDGDTYRAVYTVKFESVIYVLHAFQKKSKKGSKTPQHDMSLIKSRLKLAEQHYEENYKEQKTA
jgi:phage-related protein